MAPTGLLAPLRDVALGEEGSQEGVLRQEATSRHGLEEEPESGGALAERVLRAAALDLHGQKVSDSVN